MAGLTPDEKRRARRLGVSRPNKGRELALRKELLKLNAEMQKDIQCELQEFFAKQAKAQDALLMTLVKLMAQFRSRWYRKYELRGRILSRWLANSTKRLTEKQIQKKLKQLGMALEVNYSKQDKQFISNAVQQSTLLIKSIPQQYIGQLQKSLNEAMNQGYDSQHLQARVTKILEDAGQRNDNRAFLISRDQMQRVTQEFTRQSAKELGAKRGRWIHVPGMRSSRITHQHMDGKVFDLDTGLYDRDVHKNVLPGQLPYCMCQFEVLMPGFDE